MFVILWKSANYAKNSQYSFCSFVFTPPICGFAAIFPFMVQNGFAKM